MCSFKLKIITLAFFLNVLNSAGTDVNNNDSYYLRANATTMSRHYAIFNGSATFSAIMPVLQLRDIDSSDYKGIDEDDDELDVPGPADTKTFEKHLEQSSVIFGLTKVANASNVSRGCHRHLQRIQRAILRKQPWAMKVLDASGTKPSGFLFGQNFWFGSREACGAVQNTVEITLSSNFQRVMHRGIITQKAPFEMNYRVIYLRHHSPWQVEIKVMSEQIIHIGLCLPTTCTSDEVQELTTDYIKLGLFVENDIYDMNPEVIYMKDLKLRDSFYQRSTFKLVCASVVFTTAMMFAAFFLRVKPTPQLERDIVDEKFPNAVNERAQTAKTIACGDGDKADDGTTMFMKMRSFCMCFDISGNYDKLFATSNVGNEIPVINGLRSVSAIWIMIFHVMWYMYFTVDNKTFLLSYAEKAFFQYISSAPLLVDVFFTISGFLQTYNFIRNTRQMEIIRQNNLIQNLKQFLRMFFHRYIRLAPLYLVIMGVVDLFYALIGDVSLFHINENERFDEICSQHWWRNLLFIQNLFNHSDMCLNWTWSLACEMQYFICATILLFTYTKHPKFVKAVAVTTLVTTILWSYAIGMNSKFQLSFDVAFATGTQIYISPFVRIMPYIIGSMVGWYLIEKNFQFEISNSKEKCFWNLAILIFFLCIYSTINRDMSYFSSISLFVIGRFLFSGSVCWMIVGSATGRGSWWSRLLEAKVFQHLNRLSYAFYLLNPFMVAVFFSLASVSTHADPFMLCVMTSGFAVIVYLASIVFSLAFEVPYCNWSGLMLKSSKQKNA